MLQTVEGIYREGTIELLEKPETISQARVIVTFLNENNGENTNKTGSVNLAERDINAEEAAAQRAAFASFAEDWERPEMDVYDKL